MCFILLQNGNNCYHRMESLAVRFNRGAQKNWTYIGLVSCKGRPFCLKPLYIKRKSLSLACSSVFWNEVYDTLEYHIKLFKRIKSINNNYTTRPRVKITGLSFRGTEIKKHTLEN